MKKKLFVILLLCFVMTLGLGANAAAAPDIQVLYDGEKIAFDVQPQLVNDRTMVPFRKIFETLNYSVDWNGADKTITATDGTNNIKLTMNSYNIEFNGKTVKSDTAPYATGSRVLVPVRIISELSGRDVLWDEKNVTVLIYNKIDTPWVDGDLQYIAHDGQYFYALSQTERVMQINSADGSVKELPIKADSIRTLQAVDGKVIAEAENKNLIYNTADGTTKTIDHSVSNHQLYKSYYYDGKIIACYFPNQGEKNIQWGIISCADNSYTDLGEALGNGNRLLVYNDRIFADNIIYNMNTGEIDQAVKADSARKFCGNTAVNGDYYFFGVNDKTTKQSYFCLYNYKTGESKTLPCPQDKDIFALSVTDNSLYYYCYDLDMTNCYLVRTTLNGTNPVVLKKGSFDKGTGFNMSSLNLINIVDNEIIYYCNEKKADGVYLNLKGLSTDGQKTTTYYSVKISN